jgi:FkbM family methyltransferase
MYIKKRFYRIIESIIKLLLKFKNNSKNEALKKTLQSAIYNTTPKGKILLSENNQTKLLLPSVDWISTKIFIDGSFDYGVLSSAIKILGKKNSKSFLINIGAQIGSTCIPAIKNNYFKNLIAFEPAKKSFRLLKANIFLNGIEDRTKIYNLALSNKKTNLHLGERIESNIGSSRILTKKQKNSEIVKSDLLDNYTNGLNRNNSLIFMDAEGHEPYILLGAKKTLKKRIPIVFEFAPKILDKHWLKNLSIVFKNYNFFYDLQSQSLKKEKFNKENLVALFNKLNTKEEIYTDLMII